MRLVSSFVVAATLVGGCGGGASDPRSAIPVDAGSDFPNEATMAAPDSEPVASEDVSDATASLDSQACPYADAATPLATDAAACADRAVVVCTNVKEQIVTLLNSCQGDLFESDIEIEFRDGCATGFHGGAPAVDLGCLESTLNAQSWSCAVGFDCAAWGISTLR
jgi:hypothetical protein